MTDTRTIAEKIVRENAMTNREEARLIDAIDETLRNEREWISVETRLPNLEDRVLAWYTDGSLENGWATDETWTIPDLSTCRARGVSHWKPFAPPTLTIRNPKGE